jgi:hypothetical protein
MRNTGSLRRKVLRKHETRGIRLVSNQVESPDRCKVRREGKRGPGPARSARNDSEIGICVT